MIFTPKTSNAANKIHFWNGKTDALSNELKALGNSIIEKKGKWDFEKSSSSFTILVNSDQMTPELYRKTAFEIYELIKSELNSIEIEEANKTLYPFIEGLALSSYQFDRFLSKKNKPKLTEVFVPGMDALQLEELEATTKAVFWARDMVNTPVSHLNAEQFSTEISDLLSSVGVVVEVLEKSKIEALKMGGLLAVNKGSIDPPTFTIAEYKPANAKNQQAIVLVGKGVVYDTGGLSLKPTPGSMDVMKSDMAGAAGVIGALYLAAKQKLPVHVIALIPATDNRPGLNAYTPGDVVTMFNGSTVEVLNTDAEGRMILADALSYSAKYNPALVIDAATLTGAALRAIGTHAAIIMGNAEDTIFNQLESAGNQVHERVVRFPFWEEYKEEMKSKIADLKNIGGPNGGMISAGKFLETFVSAPYVHMDVAGPTWLDAKENYKGISGTGYGVRLLYTFLKNY